jgi:DNA-binding transcriptional ArsR family regulator
MIKDDKKLVDDRFWARRSAASDQGIAGREEAARVERPEVASATPGGLGLRVQFTPGDLARTRLSAAPAPLVETWAGLIGLQGDATAPSWWARRALGNFPAASQPLLDLISPHPPWPSFILPALPDLEEALEVVRATPRACLRNEVAASWHGPGRPPSWLRGLADGDTAALDMVVRALRDLHMICVAPHWARIVATFRADIEQRIPVMAVGGLGGLFGTLHKDLTWCNNALERAGRVARFGLGGAGLQILPSVLWTGFPVFACHPGEFRANTLIYPARQLPPADGARPPSDLAGLIGNTRAAVLQALRTPRSTRELAAAVGASDSSASEHAAALRRAGLVQTDRCGRSVSHSLTTLGRSLLYANIGFSAESSARSNGRQLRQRQSAYPVV